MAVLENFTEIQVASGREFIFFHKIFYMSLWPGIDVPLPVIFHQKNEFALYVCAALCFRLDDSFSTDK